MEIIAISMPLRCRWSRCEPLSADLSKRLTGDELLAMDDPASAEASYCEVRPSAQDAPYGDFRH